MKAIGQGIRQQIWVKVGKTIIVLCALDEPAVTHLEQFEQTKQ
ncbi:hypothetical protein [Reticulibacter mediterranei]|nr:hypothetical protein [Reticulibacter mediterranei]